jgi:hypothetical protein
MMSATPRDTSDMTLSPLGRRSPRRSGDEGDLMLVLVLLVSRGQDMDPIAALK